MLFVSLVALALAGVGIAQEVPEGYKTVYLTSMVDTTFVVQPKAATAGSTLVVQTLAKTPIQQWYLTEGDSKIQLAGTTLCMDAGTAWRNMGPISIQECDDAATGQQWDVMADGRIAVKASPAPQQCIDLQYMRATPNNPVGTYTCAGLGNIGAKDAGLNWPLVEATE